MAAKKKPARSGFRKIKPKQSLLGKRIDVLYDTRQKRLAFEREVEGYKKIESALKDEVKGLLQAEKLTSGRGTRGSVSIKPVVVAKPDPEKWAEIYAWIAENDAWDLIRKQINDEPFRARVEAGVEIPNVKADSVIKVSVTKAPSR